MDEALGLIEAVGLTTAITALDAASKAADITLIGIEKVIGAGQLVSITIQLAGEVAAISAAVEAGCEAGNKVGTIISSNIIPRPHEELDKIIREFSNNLRGKKESVENNELDDQQK